MARPLVPDELWEVVQPPLPRHRAKPGKRGRPPVDDRAWPGPLCRCHPRGLPLVLTALDSTGQRPNPTPWIAPTAAAKEAGNIGRSLMTKSGVFTAFDAM